MAPTHGWISVDGGQLPFVLAGEGPVVIFCHAGVADLTMWEPQFEPLQREFQVVAYDARGYGRSVSAPGTFSPIADLACVIDTFGGRRVALVGCSMGAATALEFATLEPARIAGVVWACGTLWGLPWTGDPEEARLIEERIALKADEDWSALADLDVRYWVDGPRTPGRAPSALRQYVRDRSLANMERPDLGLVLDFEPAGDESRVAAATCPILLIVGEYDATGISAAADTIQRHATHAERMLLPTAHLPNLERPAAFTDAVRGFLRRAAFE